MINENFRIDSKFFEQHLFLRKACPRKFSHRMDSVLSQFPYCTGPDLPEISQWLMIPKQIPEGLFIEGSNPYTVWIRSSVLGDDIHGEFAQIQIGPDPGGCSNSGGIKYLADDCFCQIIGRHPVMCQIGSNIHKHLINGVHMNVLWRNIFQINRINFS